MKASLLMVGPCPPPDGGTTIPFRLFSEYMRTQYAERYRIRVVNSNTGDKTSVRILTLSVLSRLLGIYLKAIVLGCRSTSVIVFGSQRFITFTGAMLIIFLKPLGKKVYLRVNGGAYDVFYESGGVFSRFLARVVLSKADRVIVQTQQVANRMRAIWPNSIGCIPNYRVVPEFLDRERSFSESHVVFLYTGIVRGTKGCEDMLQAYLMLKERLKAQEVPTEVRLDIFGSVKQDEGEPIYFERYTAHEDIVFHGQVPNEALITSYLAADVFVFPTRWPTEGHSGSVVEAMVYGLPILCSRWRAMPEVVEEGVSGMFFDPGDIGGLAEAMYVMCTDIEMRKRLSAGAREGSRKFDSRLVCPRLAELFEL